MQGYNHPPSNVEHIAFTSGHSGARARHTIQVNNDAKPPSSSDEDWRWHIDNWEDAATRERNSPPPMPSSMPVSSAHASRGNSPLSKPASYSHTAPKAFDPYARWDSWGAASMRRPAPSTSTAESLRRPAESGDDSKAAKVASKRPSGASKGESWFSCLFSDSLIPTVSVPASSDPVEQNEPMMLLLLILATFVTRFYRLDVPPGMFVYSSLLSCFPPIIRNAAAGICFDETHFGRFTNQYTAGTYLFDIHPPLGKLVFWAVGWFVGFDHTACK
jgi:hypothetical protein